VAEVGAARARVWHLYMAGSADGFEDNRIQVHQVLGVKTGPDGDSRMPDRPDW
jgi:cyclopropane-fatty-acyl-phospholipid synthase